MKIYICIIRLQMVLLFVPFFAYRFEHNVLIHLQNYVMIFFENHVPKEVIV